jgi:hypothetical protein
MSNSLTPRKFLVSFLILLSFCMTSCSRTLCPTYDSYNKSIKKKKKAQRNRIQYWKQSYKIEKKW